MRSYMCIAKKMVPSRFLDLLKPADRQVFPGCYGFVMLAFDDTVEVIVILAVA